MQTLTVTVIQTDLAWEDKEANLQMLERKIKNIPERTELVVLPEMFSTGFSMNTEGLSEPMDGDTIGWMKRVASEQKIIITGSIIIKEGENFFNRMIWMLPNGEYGTYDKRHLFSYGQEHKFFTAGNERVIAQAKGWKINLQICYDLRFPVWARNCVNAAGQPEYDLLIYVASWPAKRSHAWKTLLCARAIENQSYVIGVNRTGIDGNELVYTGNTMIIDPLGELLYHCAVEEDVFTIVLSKDQMQDVRNNLPFLKDGDEFNLKKSAPGG